MLLTPIIALIVVVCLYRVWQWQERGRIKPMPRILSLAESKVFACRYCGCHWRRWDDGLWSLADGDQRPCDRCDNEFMDLVEVTK